MANWITVPEAAERYGREKITIWRIAKREKIPVQMRRESRKSAVRVVDADALEAYLRSVAVTDEEWLDRYMTLPQAADYLGCRPHTLENYMTYGRLPRKKAYCQRTRREVVVFEKKLIERFKAQVEARKVPPMPANPKKFIDQTRYRKLRELAVEEHEKLIEQEVPQERVLRRCLAVRLLMTSQFVDRSANPHYVGHLTAELVDQMESRILSGEVAVTIDRLPIRQRPDDYEGDSQRYCYSPVGIDRTYVRVGCR